MKVIEQSVEIMSCSGQPVDGNAILKHLETVGRNCYRSHDKVKNGSAEKFVRGIVASGHGSVIEHVSLSVKFITSRDVTHQIVRHRAGNSFSQESQRYVNYSKEKFGKEITVVRPPYLEFGTDEFDLWKESCESAEQSYFNLTNVVNCTAEEARAVLPNSTKTELVMTSNLRALRHFIEVRADKHAQLPIRFLALDLLEKLHEAIPVVFDDLYKKFIEFPKLCDLDNAFSVNVEGNCITAQLKVGNTVLAKGVSRCLPTDDFNYDYGLKFALARMCADYLKPYIGSIDKIVNGVLIDE